MQWIICDNSLFLRFQHCLLCNLSLDSFTVSPVGFHNVCWNLMHFPPLFLTLIYYPPVPAHVSSRSSSPDRDQTPRPVLSLALYVNSRDSWLVKLHCLFVTETAGECKVTERAGKHTHTRTAGQYMTDLIEAGVTVSNSRHCVGLPLT